MLLRHTMLCASSWLLSIVCLGLLSYNAAAAESRNLLRNPDCEEELSGEWYCPPSRCTFHRTNESSYTGNYSIKVYNR